MPSRICCTVIAGVHFFSPPGFGHQKPRGDERQNLMMMPALPVANLVVGQARFALGASDAFFDAMLGFGDAGELGYLGIGSSHSTSSNRFGESVGCRGLGSG